MFVKLPHGNEEHFINKDIGIVVACWRDNGIVTIASNEYRIAPAKKVGRYSAAEKEKARVRMPYLISK